jgi:MFS family permease
MREDTDRQSTIRSAASGIRRFPLLQPLAGWNFRLLWMGESISVFGNFFMLIALAWVVLEATGSGLALGTVLMAAAIPRALFMLFGGVVSDRLSPRLVMLVSNTAQGVLVALLAFLIFAGTVELWHLYILMVIFGIVGAFFLPAMMTMIPRLVSKDRLEAANSLVIATSQLSAFIGPAAAGFVVDAAGGAVAMGVDAATFAVATVTLLLMRGISLRRRSTQANEEMAGPAGQNSAFYDMKEGLRYAWNNPEIRVLLPVIAVVNFCFTGPIEVGLAWLAHQKFVEGAAGMGIMFMVFGGTAVFGALLAGSIKMRHLGIVFTVIVIVIGAGLGLVGVAPNLPVACVLLGIMGIVNSFLNVRAIAWLQRMVRPDMLGRVMSLVMFASMGLAPVSLALAGWLVDMDHTVMFAIAGGLTMLTGLFMATSRTIRAID